MVKHTDSIFKFFEDLYNASVNVDIYYIPLKGRNGVQKKREIFIDCTVSELDQEMNLVHEINHVYQDMGYSVCIKNIKRVLVEDKKLPESTRRYEIDSRIVELLYAYNVFGMYGVELLKERLYKNCPVFNQNMTACIRGLIECEVKTVLLDDLYDAYVLINK